MEHTHKIIFTYIYNTKTNTNIIFKNLYKNNNNKRKIKPSRKSLYLGAFFTYLSQPPFTNVWSQKK